MIQDIHQQYCWHISEEYQLCLQTCFPVCHPSSGCQSVLPSMNRSASADGGTGKIGDGLIFPFRYWTMDQRVGRYTIHQAHNLGHQHTYIPYPIPFSGSKFHPQTWPLGCATWNTHLSNHETPRSWHTWTQVWYQKIIPKPHQQKKTHDDKHPETPPSKESESGVATANPLGYLQKRNLASVVVASEANPRLLPRSNRKRTSWCCRLQDPQDHPREIWRKQKHGEIEISQWKIEVIK